MREGGVGGGGEGGGGYNRRFAVGSSLSLLLVASRLRGYPG